MIDHVANTIVIVILIGVGLAMLWAVIGVPPEDPWAKAERQADEADWWDYNEGFCCDRQGAGLPL